MRQGFAHIILFLLLTVAAIGAVVLLSVNKQTDNCGTKGVAGQCEALIYGYEFNTETNSCEQFLWGGCEGIVPFKTLEECQASCE